VFAEDLSVFFDTAGFADSATLDGDVVQVIRDDASVEVFDNGALTSQPSVLLTAAQAAEAAPGSVLVTNSVTYTVRQVVSEPPDGALVRLMLAEV
jgi:hypothetical protein